MAPSKDPESGEKKNIKRTLSSGKLLVDDPGWLGPFNRLVWAYPNSILYSLLILGAVIFVLMKQAHHSTNAVRSTRRERPSKKGSFLTHHHMCGVEGGRWGQGCSSLLRDVSYWD